MHVYHYNHTERSSLERLATEHGVAELALEQLISTGLFVDLLPIVTRRDAGRRRVATASSTSSGSPTTSAATTSSRVPARSSSTSGG